MKRTNLTKVMITKEDILSIAEFNNNSIEIAHLHNGIINEQTIHGGSQNVKIERLEVEVLYYSTEILANILKAEYDAEAIENSIRIETSRFEIWVDLNIDLKTGKVEFNLSSILLSKIKNCVNITDIEANKTTRKTFKGLCSYIKAFE